MVLHSTLSGSNLHNPLGHSAVGDMDLASNTADAYRISDASGYRVFTLDTTTGSQRANFGSSDASGIQANIALHAHTTHTSAPTAPSTGGLIYARYNGVSAFNLYCKGSDDTEHQLNVSGGSGDFSGPASSTDNAVVRFDGTGGKTGQNSLVTIDDSGYIGTPTILIIGNGAHGTPGTNATILGDGAAANGTSGTAVGYNSTAAGNYGVAVGNGADATGLEGVAVGVGALVTPAEGIAIGSGATVGAGDNGSIAIGEDATTTTANQLVIGGTSSITTAYIGNGVTNASPANVTIAGTGSSSSPTAGASVTIQGGLSSGTAGDDGGALNLYGGNGSGAAGQHGAITIGENDTTSILSDVKFNHNLLRMRGGTIGNAEEDMVFDAFSAQTTSASAADTTLFTLDDDTVYLVEMRIVARQQDAGTPGRAVYVRKGCFYREATGFAVQEGSSVLDTTIEDAGSTAWNANFYVSGADNILYCRLNGDVTYTVEWNIHIMYTAISTS